MKEKGDGLNFWLPTKTKEIEDGSYPLAFTINTRVLQDSNKDVRTLRVPWYWIVWHKLLILDTVSPPGLHAIINYLFWFGRLHAL